MAEDTRPQDLRFAAVLGVAAGVSAILVFPYLLALRPELGDKPIPPWLIAVIQGVQMGVFASLMAYAGLRTGRSVGLGAPLLRLLLSSKSSSSLSQTTTVPRAWVKMIFFGLAIGGLTAAAGSLFDPYLPPPEKEIIQPGPMLGFLASFYGGIAEEIQCRLFGLTVIAWLLHRMRFPRPKALLHATLISALFFGLLHLPLAASFWGLSPLVIVRTVALNLLAGIPLGFLFIRYGLAHAALAHFSADIVLHVLLPIME